MAVKHVAACTDRWSRNCPDVEEMKITRVAKYVGARIGSNGYLHGMDIAPSQISQGV